MRADDNKSGLWLGLLLVLGGAGLLARELGVLPHPVTVLDFWPLFVVVFGISWLLRAGGLASASLALAFVATGGVLLASNLGFLASSVTRFWPLLLVLLGLWALFRRERDAVGPGPQPPEPFESDEPPSDDASSNELALRHASDEHRLIRQYTASGAQLRIESQAWRGGQLGVTAGGVELDLRQARLAPEGAVLAVRVLMGGIEIRVPDTWHVQCDVVPFFGGADDTTRSTQGVSTAPRLRIVGDVTLGGVSISN